MSSLGLSQEELKAVEQTRQRLSQLSASIDSLANDVFQSNPLPSVDSLGASADVLNHNVRAIVEVLDLNEKLFNRVTIHPSTNFPGRTQEQILVQLLRKRPEPDVETTIEEAQKTIASMPLPGGAQPSSTTDNADKEKEMLFENIWEATSEACQARITDYVVNEEGDYFTAEEHEMGIENVRTGLRRNFEDEYEDEDEEMEDDVNGNGVPGRKPSEPDVMIIDRPPPPPAPAVSTQEVEGATLETVMRISLRGQLTG